MLDSSCSETPKTKKKTAQNRPVQRFWPDSIASGAAQPAASELTVSEGGHRAGRPCLAGAGEAVNQGQAAVFTASDRGDSAGPGARQQYRCAQERGVHGQTPKAAPVSLCPSCFSAGCVCVSCAHCLVFHPVSPQASSSCVVSWRRAFTAQHF